MALFCSLMRQRLEPSSNVLINYCIHFIVSGLWSGDGLYCVQAWQEHQGQYPPTHHPCYHTAHVSCLCRRVRPCLMLQATWLLMTWVLETGSCTGMEDSGSLGRPLTPSPLLVQPLWPHPLSLVSTLTHGSIIIPSGPDPHNLGIRCRLNGETVQNSNTNQLVHKTQGLVTFLSRYICYLLLFYYTLPPPLLKVHDPRAGWCGAYWDPPWSRLFQKTSALS